MKNTIKILGIIALMAVIGFSMSACKIEEESQYFLTINGIPAKYDGHVGIVSLVSGKNPVAYAGVTINSTTVTLPLLDFSSDGPWGENGSYSVVVILYENRQALNNKITSYEGATMGTISVNQETTVMNWSQLFDVTDS
jgi:hypothetical protein